MWWKNMGEMLIDYSVSSAEMLEKHPDKVVPEAILAGKGMDNDELRHYYPYSETDHFKQIIARSNCSSEIDLRKFLKSRYVRNRVIRVDTGCGHVQFQHTIIPPVTQLIKSIHKFPIPDRVNGHSQLLQCKRNGYIIFTIRPEGNERRYIKRIRKEICDGCGCFMTCKSKDISFHPESLNKGQLYIAVVRFTGKYVTMYTKYPYSHIDVYSIHDKNKASKLVARFENGDEITINDSR